MRSNADNAEDGRGTLRDRVAPVAPPPELADRVRRSLEARGLVRPSGRDRSLWATRVGLIAAGIIIGVLGRGAFHDVRESLGQVNVSAPVPQFVLLLYGTTAGDTGVVHVAREREYGRWASELSDGARWVGGNELADIVEDLRPAGAAMPPGDDRLAGYFVIEAPSRERAAEVARTCPHIRYGGRVVVMSIAS